MKKSVKIGLSVLILLTLGAVYFQDKILLYFASEEETENLTQVDFFIKQNCYFSTSNLIEKISKISNVSLVYKIPSNELSESFNLDI